MWIRESPFSSSVNKRKHGGSWVWKLNNNLNNAFILIYDFIYSGLGSISRQLLRREKRRLNLQAKVQWKQQCITYTMFIVESIQSLLLEVLLFNWIFNWCLLTKGRWNVIENHEKCSWSVQVTSSVTCLETFRNIKMHCSVTWINLVRWIHRLCYHSHLTRDPSCTKLRLGSTVLSFSLVNRFAAGKANQKVFQLVGYVYTWI